MLISGVLRSCLIAGILAGASLFFATGCQMPASNSFRQEVSMKDGVWPASNQPVFTVDIRDTAATYQTYILLRHDDTYPFSNIWLRLSVMQPGDTVFSEGERINLRLADVSGAWLGKGMGSIWEHKIPLGKKEGLQFSKSGIYKIRISQIMREDPLSGILNAGIMVQKRD